MKGGHLLLRLAQVLRGDRAPSNRGQQSWTLAAEELVRHVRRLLDSHREAIGDALAQSLGRDDADFRLRQLDRLIEALEIELWRTQDPNKAIGGAIADGLQKTLAVVGLTVTGLVTSDVYHALTAAEDQAERVIECVVRDDNDDSDDDDRTLTYVIRDEDEDGSDHQVNPADVDDEVMDAPVHRSRPWSGDRPPTE